MNNDLVKLENNEIIVATDVVEQIKNFHKLKAEMDIKEKELKASLKEAMEKKGIKKFIINGLCATIKEGTTRKSIDTKRIKEEIPEVYEMYLKESKVASSITLTYEG